jgi:hypothetical protein
MKKKESRKELAERFFGSLLYVPDRTSDIRKAIEEKGRYHDAIEWRISTVTELSVEPVEERGKRWFRASAKCDHEFTCHAPTIERAAQFLRIYEQLIADMLYAVGWPSWASKTKLESGNGAD